MKTERKEHDLSMEEKKVIWYWKNVLNDSEGRIVQIGLWMK